MVKVELSIADARRCR